MKKIVLIDADGVIQHPNPYFPGYLEQTFGWGGQRYLECLDDLFHSSIEYSASLEGRGDFQKALQEHLIKWRCPIASVEFMTVWFEDNIVLDKSFVLQLSALRGEDVQVYLASNQEINRAQFMIRRFDLSDYFDGLFFSYELGYQKPQPDYFKAIMDRLGCWADKMIFVDDNHGNVESATRLGIHAIHHKDSSGTLEKIALALQEIAHV